MTKSYLVEFKIHRKMAYYSLQKIVLDRFPRNFFILSAIVNDTCMQEIKIGHRAKFRDRDNFFSAGFISVSRDFTPYFHFRCVARATFDRNLIHSADACFLVMACVGYSRVQLKTLSSLLNTQMCIINVIVFGTLSTSENFFNLNRRLKNVTN